MNSAASATETSLADLKRKSVRGGVVTVLSQGISTLVNLVSTVVLARLLSPEDFGVMSMVAAITAFAALFQDLGLSTAAVQKGQLSHALQSNLFWVNVALGTLLTGTLATAAPLVARFYDRPELTWVTVTLSFNFLIRSLGTQHGVMLTRRMQFGRKAAASIGGSLVGLGISIYLAVKGYRYWALVWGGLAGAATSVLLLWLVSPFRPCWASRGTGVLSLVRFGANVTGFNIINYFHRNLDNLLIGKVWGAEPLGLYTRAYALLMFPIHAIRDPLTAVAFPAMSKLQGQPLAFRSYYRDITATTAFLSMPLTAYLFVAAKQVITLILGEAWNGVVPIFAALALAAFIQPVASLRGMALLATGQSRRYFWWGVLNAGGVSVGFVLGLPWGAVGVATGYVLVNYALLYPSLLLAFHKTCLGPRDFFQPIAGPAAASVMAAIVCYPFVRAISALPPAQVTAGSAILFGCAYFGLYLMTSTGRRQLARHYLSLRHAWRRPA